MEILSTLYALDFVEITYMDLNTTTNPPPSPSMHTYYITDSELQPSFFIDTVFHKWYSMVIGAVTVQFRDIPQCYFLYFNTLLAKYTEVNATLNNLFS